MTETGPQPEPINPSWPETDPDPAVHGVLLSDYIEKYSRQYKLIDPFNEESLKAASYRLHVGEEFWLNNEPVAPDKFGQVKIPQNGLLYFSTSRRPPQGFRARRQVTIGPSRSRVAVGARLLVPAPVPVESGRPAKITKALGE